ncbi:hypothetical protein SprV_0100317100 [Sparganum proliferum]
MKQQSAVPTRQALPKTKRATRESQVSPTHNANTQHLPSFLRCQWTFRAWIGLVKHLRARCDNHPTTPTADSTVVPIVGPAPTATASTTTTTLDTNDHIPDVPPSSITVTFVIPATNPATTTGFPASSRPPSPTGANTLDASSIITLTITTRNANDADSVSTCLHCDCTFIPRKVLVVHLRIQCTKNWRTSAWSTNIHPPPSPQLSAFPSHIQPSHGTTRSYASPRKFAANYCSLDQTTTQVPNTCTPPTPYNVGTSHVSGVFFGSFSV